MPDPEKLTAGWVESWENFLAQNQFPRVFLKSRDSIYLACNENYAIDHGLKASEIPGRDDYDLYPRELAEKYRADDLRILESGQSETIEERYVKNGQEFHVQTIKSPFRNPSGEVIGILGMFWDITERKRAEGALRESEVRYRELFENIKSGVAIYTVINDGQDFIFKDFNRAGERIDHDQRERLIGKSIFEVRPGVEQFGLIEVFRKVWQTGEPVVYPVTLYQDNKLSGWYENFVYKLPSGEIVAVFEDITDRKRAEEALRESERRLIEAQRIGKFGNWEWNPAENRVIWSAEMYDIFGIPPETVLTTEMTIQAFHPEDRAMVVEATRKTLDELKPQLIECRILKPDGTIGYVQGRGEIVLDANGKLVKMIGIYQDITDRKLAEEALRNREGLLQRIFDILPVGLWFADKDGKLLRGNPAGVKIWGAEPKVSLSELGIFKARRLPSGEEVTADDWALAHTIRDRATIVDELLEIDAFDGLKKTILNYTAPVLDAQGDVQGAIVVNQDITDRRNTEEALRQSEEKYRTLVENANEAIIVTQDGVLKFANPRVSELIGYSLQEVVGRSFIEFIHPDDQLLVAQRYQKRLEGEVPAAVYPFRTIHKDGSIRWAEINSVLIAWGGKPAVMSYLSDVTERKRAEDKLRKIEARFRSYFNMPLHGIAITSPDKGWIEANDRICSILGYPREELFRINWAELTHPDDLAADIEQFNRVLGGQIEQYAMDKRFIRKDGGVIWTNITVGCVRKSDGSVDYIIGLMEDITERKQAEEALRESKERLELALVGGGLGTYEHNLQTEEIQVDARYLAILGYAPGELDLANMEQWEELVHPEDLAQTRSSHTEVEYRMRHKDGHWIWVLDTGRVVEHDSLGLPLRMSGVHQDISERKQAEEALKEERNLFVSGPTMVFRWQPGLPWQVEYASPNVQELLGYPPEAFTSGSLSYADIIHPDDVDRLLQERTNHDRQGRTHFEQEYRLQRSDGKTLWVHDFTRTVIINGSLQDHGYVTDITERKRAEQGLLERDIRFKKLSAHVPGMIYQFLKKPDGTYCVPFTTEAIQEIFGCSPQDVRGDFSPIAKVILPEDFDRVVDSIEYSAEHLTPWQCEYRVQIPGQSVRWMLGQATPEKLADGSVIWHGFNTDITERKRVEEILLREQTMLARTEGIAQIGSWAWDVATDTVTWSDELFRIFQRDPREGAPSFAEHPAFYHPDDMARLQQAVEVAVALGTPYELELRAIRKDGETRVCVARGVAEMAPGGRAVHLFGSLQDITERKRVEKALQESEEKYHSVFNNFIDLYYQTDMQGLITNLSPSCFILSGWKPEELIGHQVLEFYPDPEQRKALLEKLGREGAVSDYGITLLHRDGRHLSVSVSSHLIRDAQGNSKYVEGTIRDINDRKLAEEALRESESFNRGLVENVPDYIAIYGSDGKILHVNPASATALGYSAEELVGTPVLSYVAEEYRHEVVTRITERQEVGEVPLYEIDLLTHGGLRRSVIVKGTQIQYRDIPATLLVLTDITERKRAEEALRESEEKHRAVVERANEGIVILQDGIVRFTNPSLLAMTGYETGEAEGIEFSRFIAEENWPSVLERYSKRMAGERLSGVFETVMLHKSGKKIPIEVNGGLIQYEGKPADLVIMRDISERKQIEGEMEKTRADFLFGVSHELKTPLFLMNISLEMLENSPEAGRAKRTAEFTETWKRNLHRLQHLVFNMVDSQRTQTMGFKLERQPTDFPVLVERVVAEQGLFAWPKKVRITVDLAPLPPLWIDPEAIHRLVENLLTNAIKFSPRNGEVTIRLKKEEAQAILTVKDRGPGIPTEEQKGLFLPFQRAASTVRSVIPGTGLGLYVAKIIVDAHGGTISMRSKTGQGTTVTVRLPLGAPEDK